MLRWTEYFSENTRMSVNTQTGWLAAIWKGAGGQDFPGACHYRSQKKTPGVTGCRGIDGKNDYVCQNVKAGDSQRIPSSLCQLSSFDAADLSSKNTISDSMGTNLGK